MNRNAFLTECEPYFLDGALTVARFAQESQLMVKTAVESHLGLLASALNFSEDEITVDDYWYPNKFQKATEAIHMGVKIKWKDMFEAGVLRYWTTDERETGYEVYTWMKNRKGLDELSKRIDELPDVPEPREAWSFTRGGSGTYCVDRVLNQNDLLELHARLDEVITYYTDLIVKIGGVRQFMP